MLADELTEMLRLKNGFYAYESSLLVRPIRNERSPLGLLEWNAPELWKASYSDNLVDVLFFAEDVFAHSIASVKARSVPLSPKLGFSRR